MRGIAKSSNGSRGGEFQKRSWFEDESRDRCAERNARTRRGRETTKARRIHQKEGTI
jgi:hypothetical protein